jgi:hypothetical protein
MKKEIVAKLNMSFEEAAYQEDDIEYWLARDLQVLLNYTEWRNFLQVVEKAKTACENSDQYISDHFVDVNKTINMPKGATKQIDDIMLTRYAAILIMPPPTQTAVITRLKFSLSKRITSHNLIFDQTKYNLNQMISRVISKINPVSTEIMQNKS